eukprot:SAG31_NODE_203_length_20490_cov_7.713256_10_plen_694_part_00
MADRLSRLAALEQMATAGASDSDNAPASNDETPGVFFMGDAQEVLGFVDEEKQRRARRRMFLQDVYLQECTHEPEPENDSGTESEAVRVAAANTEAKAEVAAVQADAQEKAAAIEKLERANKLKEMEIDMLKMELEAERKCPGFQIHSAAESDAAAEPPVSPKLSPAVTPDATPPPSRTSSSPRISTTKNVENLTAEELIASANMDLLNLFLRASLKHKLAQNLTQEQLDMLEDFTDEEYGDGDPEGSVMPKMLQLLVKVLSLAISDAVNAKDLVAPTIRPKLEQLQIQDPQAGAILYVAEYLFTRTKQLAGFTTLVVSITKAEFRKDEKGNPFTLYELEIKTPEGRRKWNAEKRYSDFTSLLATMRQSVAENIALKLPHLPPKLFGKARLQDDVVEARRIDLEKFLRRLSVLRQAMEVELARTVWHDFLKTPPDLRHAGAAKQDKKKPRALLQDEPTSGDQNSGGVAGLNDCIFRAVQIVDHTDERDVLCCARAGFVVMEPDEEKESVDPNGMTTQKIWAYYPVSQIQSFESSTCNRGKTKTCDVQLAREKKPLRFCMSDPNALVAKLKQMVRQSTAESVQPPDFVELFWKRCINTDRGSVRWQPDKETKQCNACQTQFKMLSKNNRRHHCRHCGYIFCNTCSRNQIELVEMDFAPDDPQRVCTHCFHLLNAYKNFKKHGYFSLKVANQLDQ